MKKKPQLWDSDEEDHISLEFMNGKNIGLLKMDNYYKESLPGFEELYSLIKGNTKYPERAVRAVQYRIEAVTDGMDR